MVEIHGAVAPGFEPVLEAFQGNFEERGEVGASVCVTVAGEAVVDLWGGLADPGQRRAWERDTLVNFYSAGKPLIATLVLQCVDAGLLALDDPIASVWPEFSVGGKEGATVRHALCHLAGVPAIAAPLSEDDLWSWDTMTAALAATPACYEPGTRVWYHANTYGHLVGEILRRVTGELPGDRLARLAGELGADVHVGLEDDEQRRCATVLLPDRSSLTASTPRTAEHATVVRGYFNPPGYSSFGVVNTPEWRRAQIPAANGHGTAAGLAAFYAALLEEGRVLSAPLLAEATRTQAEGDCPVLGERVGFGLGFAPTSARRRLGPNEGAYGHFGTGGAAGFADPVRSIAFGYVMNHVIPRWQSSRNRALIDALYACM